VLITIQTVLTQREGRRLNQNNFDSNFSFQYIGNMEMNIAIKALAALAQETRLTIFRALVQAGESGLSAGQLAKELNIPNATLSFHLKELSHAELIIARQESRFIFYSANFATMNELLSYLTENCCTGTSCNTIDVCCDEKSS
jgi:DNA-binding transcriptional ArsR family regulator